MNEQENTKIIGQAYEHFKKGDISALLDSYSEDIDWHLPEIENVSFGGKHRGRQRVAIFFQSLAEAQEVLTFNPQEFIAQCEKVVVLGDYSWRVKSNGKEFGSDWAHVWTVKDGKIAGFKEYTDTAATSNAHKKAAAGA